MNWQHGLVRITCASPRVHVADPAANAREIIDALAGFATSDIVLFPELCLTGYTCGDLFGQRVMVDAAITGLDAIRQASTGRRQLVVVGLPVPVGNSLFNGAAAVADGRILGIVPKQFLPTYKEFYEARWFQAATGGEPRWIELPGLESPGVTFGIDLLFGAGPDVVVGIEICEDLWVPSPPSGRQALAGATILLNPSASNETIGKAAYRRSLVVGQSARCMAAYAYAGSGPGESTTDIVFGGHNLVAENGRLLGESPRVGDGSPLSMDLHAITCDVDVASLLHDRRTTTTFDAVPTDLRSFCRIDFELESELPGLERTVVARPFVPSDSAELDRRCAEIFGIQCAGLAKRLSRLSESTPLNIGISGGLDSTLALLVAVKTCDAVGRDRKTIHGLTMPGFGTTSRTRSNALALMDHLGIAADTIDISELSFDSFRALGHRSFGIDLAGLDLDAFRRAIAEVPRERRQDLVFENVQARLRTFLLMSRGFVIGTGDLSELALGWATYNGDHMSMYNVNGSIPKTLVEFLVEYVARHEFDPGPVRDTLLSIASTVISPELLPASTKGEIEQSTEDVLGPYEIHDFILYHAIRLGMPPSKIRFLARHADFRKPYPSALIDRTLRTFYTRFFANQFKRSCVPDGPKVGSVSLSPRGDWRMPSDAEAAAWLADLEADIAAHPNDD
jgi:NAD+ synthase (glutamine-hydrolysing)